MEDNSKKWVIFDLDGTLANIEIRRKMATKSNGKMDWEIWLKKHRVEYNILKMRPTNHPWKFMPDEKLKLHWFNDLWADNEEKSEHEVVAVFDDRDKVVKMWREIGLTCMQVAPGNF